MKRKAPEPPDVVSDFLAAWTGAAKRWSVDKHLIAYILDRNPRHVFDAYRLARESGLTITETMHRWLDLAVQKDGPKPRRFDALAAMDLVEIACRLSGTATLPDRLRPDVIDGLKRQFPGVPVKTIEMQISRVRRAWSERGLDRKGPLAAFDSHPLAQAMAPVKPRR